MYTQWIPPPYSINNKCEYETNAKKNKKKWWLFIKKKDEKYAFAYYDINVWYIYKKNEKN